MATIALLSCTKSKLPHKAKAKDLYSPSPWFPKAYEYVKKTGADKVFILSALYGLVPEDMEIEPYEKTLAGASRYEKREWAQKILTDLSKTSDWDNDQFIIIAGKNYYENIVPHLKHTELPLKGCTLYQWVPRLNELLGSIPNLSIQSTREENSVGPDNHSLSYELHRFFNSLPRHRYPYDEKNIPLNGIYIMFEEGEKFGDLDRVVRVGTHISPNRLRPRIRDHYVTENKDGSIFRKNIGRALLNLDRDPYLKIWEYDLSKTKDPRILNRADKSYQSKIEKTVSKYIRTNISFVCIRVVDDNERLRIEEGIIAAFNRDPFFVPSSAWLGQHSPKLEIFQSGMWLVQGLDEEPLTDQEFMRIKLLMGSKVKPAVIHSTPQEADKVINKQPLFKTNNKITAQTFSDKLGEIIKDARSQDRAYVEVVSGDLHRLVGGYPGSNHKMPTCCNVMYSLMKGKDEILAAPPSGKGASLKIRYWL